MNLYSRINVELPKKTNEKARKVYEEFMKGSQKYLLDEVMQLYRIPMDTPFYQDVVTKIKTFPEEEIDWYEQFERTYSKQDYRDAVAYLAWFTSMAFGYESDDEMDCFASPCCEKGRENERVNYIQSKPYRMPQKEFVNRKFIFLEMGGYAVAKEVYEDLLEIGALEADFTPIYNKRGEIVAYQLTPVNELSMHEVNQWKEIKLCEHCDLTGYDIKTAEQLSEFRNVYLDQAAYSNLKVLNKSEMDQFCDREIIINKEAYEYLSSKYKRMNVEPVFLKKE